MTLMFGWGVDTCCPLLLGYLMRDEAGMLMLPGLMLPGEWVCFVAFTGLCFAGGSTTGSVRAVCFAGPLVSLLSGLLCLIPRGCRGGVCGIRPG